MNNDQLITILGSIVTLFILPILIDWIKRRWEYSSNIIKSRFDVLFELNSLIWNYHAITGRLYQLSMFMSMSSPSADEVKELSKRFSDASDALYSGLFSCKSKIHQYFDKENDLDIKNDDLRNWVFHGSECQDNYFLEILHALGHKNKKLSIIARSKLGKIEAALIYREKSDEVLKTLATQIRDMNSFWYPIQRLFRKKYTTSK
jgi:hypothetical protein